MATGAGNPNSRWHMMPSRYSVIAVRPAAATVPTSIGAPVSSSHPAWGIHFVVLAGLQSSFAGQMRVALADDS